MLEVRGEGRPEAGAQPSCRAEIHGKNLIYNLFVCVACMFFFFGGFVSYLDWSQVTWCCRQKKRAPNGTRFGMFLAGCPECFLASASYVSRACFLGPNRQWLQQLKAAAGPKLASKKYERKQGQRTGAI